MPGPGAPRGLAAPQGGVGLDFSPQAVAEARSVLRAELSGLRLPRSTVDDALLVASELLSNAVRYARPLPDGGMRLGWTVKGPCVEVRVTDGGATSLPRPRGAEPTDTGGRGLSIVESVSSRWGTEPGNGRMTVWALVG